MNTGGKQKVKKEKVMRKEINGSNIQAAEWRNQTLSLYFTDGSITEFYNVPEGIFAGLCTAQSAGSYLRLYVCGAFSYKKVKEANIEQRVKELEYHKNLTVGLWATDRPDLIPEHLKDVFFQITE